MSFEVQYIFRRATPPQRVPKGDHDSVGYQIHLKRFESATVSKLILDQYSYIPTQYKFVKDAGSKLKASMPEIPGVDISIDLATGEVSVLVPDSASPYQVVAVEISLPAISAT
jgi:hypothetical protein